MGFNIEQYELGQGEFSNGSIEWNNISGEWSNGSGKERRAERRERRAERRAERRERRAERRGGKGEVDDTSSTDSSNPINKGVAPTSTALTTPESTSSTGMYIGIGVGILAIGIVTMILIKRNK